MTVPSVSLTGGPLLDDDVEADAVAVPIHVRDGRMVPGAGEEEVLRAFGFDLAAYLARERAKGEVGEVISLPVVAPDNTVAAVLLVGTGDATPQAYRRAGAALARRARGRTRMVTSVAADADADGLRAFVEGLALGAYSFHRKSESPRHGPVERIDVIAGDAEAVRDAFGRALAGARATHLARDLANTPPGEKTPQWLAERAAEVAERAGLEISVRDEAELAAGGFGGLVAVGSGSSRPPRLVELRYTPDEPPEGSPAGSGAPDEIPHVVLVGKGITFDSGGLSLKSRDAMVSMKTDMSGAASVIAAMGSLRELGVTARVTGLVAAAENLPSGSAYRPGDVVTHYGGRTTEVVNTDAEGRMVLADALAYAVAELAPDVLVDVATLTGAASMGLGRGHGALYANDDALAEGLTRAGEDSGELLWRMPLVEDYRPALDSTVADLSQVGRDPSVKGGSIVAALFLREFTGGLPWAHLDIAGPARSDKDEQELTKGGTGFGARLLLRWLERYADAGLVRRGGR